MNKVAFQLMGVIVFGVVAMLLFIGIYTMTGWSQHMVLPPSLSPLTFWLRILASAIPAAVVGTGLFQFRKWAALAFSTMGLYLAFWACKDALYPVNPQPGEWYWLGWVYAFLFTIPSVATAKYWNYLVWRRKKEL